MKLLHLFFALTLLFSFSCSKKLKTQTTTKEVIINTSDLLGKWYHSYEEDKDGITTYRPEGFDFPPARGRRGCNFIEKGGYEQYEIAPADGLQTIKGSWSQADSKFLVIHLYTSRKLTYKLEIVELNKKVFRFKISNLNN